MTDSSSALYEFVMMVNAYMSAWMSTVPWALGLSLIIGITEAGVSTAGRGSTNIMSSSFTSNSLYMLCFHCVFSVPVYHLPHLFLLPFYFSIITSVMWACRPVTRIRPAVISKRLVPDGDDEVQREEMQKKKRRDVLSEKNNLAFLMVSSSKSYKE